MCKIYCIENKINGKKYIGSSTRYKNRIWQHFVDLKGGYHHNSRLQTDYITFGRDVFCDYIIEDCAESERFIREEFYIQKYNSHIADKGYNSDFFIGGKMKRGKEFSNKIRESINKFWQGNSEAKYQAVLNQKTSTQMVIVNLRNRTVDFYDSILSCGRDSSKKYSTTSVHRAYLNFPRVVNKNKNSAYGCLSYKNFKEIYNENVEEVLEVLIKQEMKQLKAKQI